MNKKKEIKAQKAIDKMLGVNKLYITLQKPLTLEKGDRVCITGDVGENGELITGRIDISRNFCPPPRYDSGGIGMPSVGMMQRG